MKIVLISPNYAIRERFGEPSDPPLGVATIAGVLEEKGYWVRVIDANAENLTADGVCSRLAKMKPDVVGISCNFSPLHHPTVKIAAMVKNKFGVPVIVGGNHSSALAEFMLEHCPDIDFVVRGEGEVILPDLLEALQKRLLLRRIKGLTFKEGRHIISNVDAPLVSSLDELPLPAYHLLPMVRYRRYNIIASRGCPYKCSYCASDVIFRRRVRCRNPRLVVKEIEYLFQHYGEKQVWFSDDTFITNPIYTHTLLDELMKSSHPIPWSCMTRVNKVTKGLLKKMKMAGCSYISYGIESGSQEVLNQIDKRITVDEILETLKVTHEVGIKQYGFFIVGFPGENWRRIMDTYRLIYQSPLDGTAFNIFIPLPGTKIMNELLRANVVRLDEIKWDHLFARTAKETYESYSAELASRWSEISGPELIEACNIGRRLPEIFAHIRSS